GSADAAATLRALGRPDPQLALQLGSDVPFFLLGGTAYATGRGEVLTPLPSLAGIPLVLVMPEERVGTAQAYAMLRRFSPPLGLERVRAMIEDDFLSHAAALINDFEEVVPHLAAIKTRLYELGAAWAGMSGSGSTIVGAFRDARGRDAALAQFTNAVAAETTAGSPD
ncbi:MAG TPA: 4-(cytidine 5'-diphospho)-2-C-methyl-D-erythritol kinase, partial [Thermoanaerobaculia bacterium]|nr:4-(cytidine 5'-diphospho)-2-C-methyl-D-erythritol kinase [Thermoanaerobaculia bacterium]